MRTAVALAAPSAALLALLFLAGLLRFPFTLK
jgi:hypothetical protein